MIFTLIKKEPEAGGGCGVCSSFMSSVASVDIDSLSRSKDVASNLVNLA